MKLLKIIETPILVENRKFKRRSWNEIGKHCRKISSEYWNFSRSRSKYGGRFENHRNSNFGRKRKFKENVSERRKILSEYWTFFSRFRSFTVDVLKIIEIQILDENRKLQRKSWNRKMCRKILSECWTRVRKSRTRMKEKRSDPPSSTSNTNHPSGFDRYLLSPNHFEGNIPGTFHKYFDTFYSLSYFMMFRDLFMTVQVHRMKLSIYFILWSSFEFNLLHKLSF